MTIAVDLDHPLADGELSTARSHDTGEGSVMPDIPGAAGSFG